MNEKRREHQRRCARLGEISASLAMVGVIAFLIATLCWAHAGNVIFIVVTYAVGAMLCEAAIFTGAMLDREKERMQ